MSTSTRQMILQRCFEAIQSKGFETLRTDKEIARLKITKGAFYHYFPNKAELGYAVVDEVMMPYYEQKWAQQLLKGNWTDEAIDYYRNDLSHKNQVASYMNDYRWVFRNSQKFRVNAINAYKAIAKIVKNTDSPIQCCYYLDLQVPLSCLHLPQTR